MVKAAESREVSPLKQQTLDNLVIRSPVSADQKCKVEKKEEEDANGREEERRAEKGRVQEDERKSVKEEKPVKEGKTAKSTAKGTRKKTDKPVSRPKRQPKQIEEPLDMRKLSDFYPVRRSKRQPLSKLKDRETQELREKIESKCSDGLEIRQIEGKGRGVFSTRHFPRKAFVVEYSGTLISIEEAKKREAEYALQPDKFGCYMYYFSFKNKKYCVDGTAEDGTLGRLLNHSVNGNVETKLVDVNSTPVLILVAKTDIPPNTELCYDYGERSKDIIESHPWLTS